MVIRRKHSAKLKVGVKIPVKCFCSFLDWSCIASDSIWLSETGIVCYKLLKPRQIMNGEYYKKELIILFKASKLKRPVFIQTKVAILLFSNLTIFTQMGCSHLKNTGSTSPDNPGPLTLFTACSSHRFTICFAPLLFVLPMCEISSVLSQKLVIHLLTYCFKTTSFLPMRNPFIT